MSLITTRANLCINKESKTEQCINKSTKAILCIQENTMATIYKLNDLGVKFEVKLTDCISGADIDISDVKATLTN